MATLGIRYYGHSHKSTVHAVLACEILWTCIHSIFLLAFYASVIEIQHQCHVLVEMQVSLSL